MTDISINVRLFGAFRKYGETVTFTMPSGSSVQLVKEKLAEILSLADAQLIRDSVLANDNEIIEDTAVLSIDCNLAILPPVCGG